MIPTVKCFALVQTHESLLKMGPVVRVIFVACLDLMSEFKIL